MKEIYLENSQQLGSEDSLVKADSCEERVIHEGKVYSSYKTYRTEVSWSVKKIILLVKGAFFTLIACFKASYHSDEVYWNLRGYELYQVFLPESQLVVDGKTIENSSILFELNNLAVNLSCNQAHPLFDRVSLHFVKNDKINKIFASLHFYTDYENKWKKSHYHGKQLLQYFVTKEGGDSKNHPLHGHVWGGKDPKNYPGGYEVKTNIIRCLEYTKKINNDSFTFDLNGLANEKDILPSEGAWMMEYGKEYKITFDEQCLLPSINIKFQFFER